MDNAPVYAASNPNDGRRSGDDSAKTFSIGDLAREFEVSLRTLRFYEDRGLLSPRRVGSSRLYDAREILKGKRLGFTLTEIPRPPGAGGAGRRRGRQAATLAEADRRSDRASRASKGRDRGGYR